MGYVDIVSSGDKSIETTDDPGVAFDLASGKIVAWHGGTKVYAFDPATNTWLSHPAASANLVNPGPSLAQGGVFGRFRYSKKLNLYILVNDVDKNVFVYKFSPGSGVNLEIPAIPSQPATPVMQTN